MATTVRLNSSMLYESGGSPPPLVVIAVGDFGAAVAQSIQQLIPAAILSTAIHEVSLPGFLKDSPAAVMLTAWRAVPDLANQLDERSFSTGTPFISLTMVNLSMLLGPVVVPGLSACWRCWAERDVQAGTAAYGAQPRRQFYRDYPLSGPQGYLPSLARLGAAQLARTWTALQCPENVAGHVIRTDLFGRYTVVSHSIGSDQCDRCGLHRDLSTRTYKSLRNALSELWTDSLEAGS